jgi:predicted enzyme related to lactoylglutathione lyase
MTNDLAAAQKFYTQVVGWTASKWDGPGGSADYTLWMSGETPIGGLMHVPEDAAKMGAPPNWLAYVEVPDVDATLAEATQLGATILGPAVDIGGVGRFAVLRDPQGAVIAIMRSANAMPDENDPQPLEFSWHELITDDAVAGLGFYQKLFGWDTKDEMDMGAMGKYHMFGRDRFTYGGTYNKPADMPAPPHWLHYVRVKDSADAAAERAKAAGAQVLAGPMEVPGGDRIAVIMDPQGAAFAVHSK